jgi:hypothetical protein
MEFCRVRVVANVKVGPALAFTTSKHCVCRMHTGLLTCAEQPAAVATFIETVTLERRVASRYLDFWIDHLGI